MPKSIEVLCSVHSNDLSAAQAFAAGESHMANQIKQVDLNFDFSIDSGNF
jgi:hypothetical protein